MRTDRQTDRQIDRPTDRQTDIATYRAAIAAKKLEGLDVFTSYCKDLWFWTNRPLEDFDHIIPIVEDVENESDGEDEECTLWFDRDPRNIDPYYDLDDPDWN